MQTSYDVVIVGGGAAGLSAGLTLARARRSVLVIDSGEPRNAPAAGVHNYLGSEGTPPGDLLSAGRDEVTGYGGEILSATVASVHRLHGDGDGDNGVDGGLGVVLDDGRSVLARRLLVTTGLVDELPDVAGVDARWGHDVLHCPYCHGWEVRDEPIGVLASGPFAVHQAMLFRQWSDDVTLFRHTAPPLTDDELEQLGARGITVVEGEVTALEVTDGAISGVRLRSGDVVPRRAVTVQPRFTARAEVLEPLGVKVTDIEMGGHVVGTQVAADPAGATDAPGVWVAGNVADVRLTAIGAAAAGVQTAGAINADLVDEDVRDAVRAAKLPA
ncbi:thioredoxin reductase [Haloactinopolyspora alba]|uniref:Thioredoxin reductase n=1 Tax=Haloactinopolyspora alba TaxID=648780 RepID=A0A2P8EG90_9ACTN|nr:NAD(P)/FAD-dependent oxidoreductase [Haloactinopolyspora alba]PSL08493.1 thioredoxin reductase [Haloactinopolyspora alba]